MSPHTLHFSPEGVHHVGSKAIHRYAWADFTDVQVTLGYIFIPFRQQGTVAIPIDALGPQFGSSPDEGFLQELTLLTAEA